MRRFKVEVPVTSVTRFEIRATDEEQAMEITAHVAADKQNGDFFLIEVDRTRAIKVREI